MSRRRLLHKSNNSLVGIPLSSLFLYYDLNGDSLDVAGTNNGIDTNVTYVSGLSGQGAEYNGTNAYTEVSGNPLVGRSQFSVTTLFKMTTGGVLYGSWGSQNEIIIRESSGNIQVYVRMTVAGVASDTFFTGFTDTTTFHHLAVTLDGTSIECYLDGVKSNTSLPLFGGTLATGNEPERICAERTNRGGYIIDGFGLWDIKLEDSQVSEIASKQLSGQELI